VTGARAGPDSAEPVSAQPADVHEAHPTTQVRTPEVTNRLTRIKFNADYPVQKNAEVRFNVIHERWKTDDWTWMMFPATGPTPWAYGAATDGTTVISDPTQNSTFVGIRYVYKF